MWTWGLAGPGAGPDPAVGLPPDLADDIATGWPTRAAAEAWLSDVFPDLVAAGVEAVTCLADGEAVYTMSLAE